MSAHILFYLFDAIWLQHSLARATPNHSGLLSRNLIASSAGKFGKSIRRIPFFSLCLVVMFTPLLGFTCCPLLPQGVLVSVF